MNRVIEIVNVSYNGKKRYPQVNLPKKLQENFSEKYSELEILIGSDTFYTTLFPSFFDDCFHLRTAYKHKGSKKGGNELIKWLKGKNKVEIEIVKVNEQIRLSEIKKM